MAIGRGIILIGRSSKAAVIVTSIVGFLLSTAVIASVVSKNSTAGTVTGQVAIHGVGPMLGGMVLFFDKVAGPPPISAKYWRVPTYAFKLDDNAGFQAELPAGTYYIGAIENVSGDPVEPPREGEYYFISQDSNGRPRTFTVKKNRTLSLGMTTAAKLFSKALLEEKGITAIEGKIRNEKGEPVEGMMVFAFKKSGRTGKPLFVSDRSDKNGKYQLRVSGGGNYYLSTRRANNKTEVKEEPEDVYQGDRMVTVKAAKVLEGIDITVPAPGVAQLHP